MTEPRAIFRYDFNSPYSYLAASRIEAVVGGPDVVRWQPIAFAFLLRAQGREPWSFNEPTRSEGKAECERRALAYGLPPMAWPPDWPVGSYGLPSLRAALVAEREGRLRAFTAAAFARLFVRGVGLKEEADVLEVCDEVGLDRDVVREGMAGWAKARLVEVTEAAIAEDVPGVPTITIDGEHLWGDDQLEDAARRLG